MFTNRGMNQNQKESERYLFDPHKKFTQSNNEKTFRIRGPLFKTSLVANIRATYYVINTGFFFPYNMLKIHNKVNHDFVRMSQ